MSQKIIEKPAGQSGRDLAALDRILKTSRNLLIVIHNHPDPDAIGSAAALKVLAEKRYGLKAHIAYRGNVGRAETRTMLQKCKITMKQFNRVRLKKYDRLALVDGQPGSGNTPEIHYHVVVDHHPRRKDTRAELVVIQPEIGVTATILVEWLIAAEYEIPADLATALTYAISSETRNLGRETSARDIQAYLSVYFRSNLRKLSQIIHPNLPQIYFNILARALQNAVVFRNLLVAHLGPVPAPEMVSEMADFFLRRERTGWVLCSGRFKNQLLLSLRSINPKARAGMLIKKIVADPDNAGGHDMSAGGAIPLKSSSRQEMESLENELTRTFAGLLHHSDAEWKPMLDETAVAAGQ